MHTPHKNVPVIVKSIPDMGYLSSGSLFHVKMRFPGISNNVWTFELKAISTGIPSVLKKRYGRSLPHHCRATPTSDYDNQDSPGPAL